MQNPFIETLSAGSKASNENYQLASQSLNSVGNLLNTAGSLSMKMIALLDQEEAQKTAELQNQQQLLNQAFHNTITKQLEQRKLDMAQAKNEAEQAANYLNAIAKNKEALLKEKKYYLDVDKLRTEQIKYKIDALNEQAKYFEDMYNRYRNINPELAQQYKTKAEISRQQVLALAFGKRINVNPTANVSVGSNRREPLNLNSVVQKQSFTPNYELENDDKFKQFIKLQEKLKGWKNALSSAKNDNAKRSIELNIKGIERALSGTENAIRKKYGIDPNEYLTKRQSYKQEPTNENIQYRPIHFTDGIGDYKEAYGVNINDVTNTRNIITFVHDGKELGLSPNIKNVINALNKKYNPQSVVGLSLVLSNSLTNKIAEIKDTKELKYFIDNIRAKIIGQSTGNKVGNQLALGTAVKLIENYAKYRGRGITNLEERAKLSRELLNMVDGYIGNTHAGDSVSSTKIKRKIMKLIGISPVEYNYTKQKINDEGFLKGLYNVANEQTVLSRLFEGIIPFNQYNIEDMHIEPTSPLIKDAYLKTNMVMQNILSPTVARDLTEHVDKVFTVERMNNPYEIVIDALGIKKGDYVYYDLNGKMHRVKNEIRPEDKKRIKEFLPRVYNFVKDNFQTKGIDDDQIYEIPFGNKKVKLSGSDIKDILTQYVLRPVFISKLRSNAEQYDLSWWTQYFNKGK